MAHILSYSYFTELQALVNLINGWGVHVTVDVNCKKMEI